MNNKIKTALIFIGLLTLSVNSAFCASLDSIIKKSNLDKTSTIAISVKDAKSGKVVYEYNEQKLMNPASVQKIFTMKTAYDQLKPEYTFDTKVFSDKNNNLYIKLSADPSLTTDDLKKLLKEAKEIYRKPFNDIVIDSSIIDNKQWGIGWMWDDDTNELLPKYSPYTINQNKISITITPNKNNTVDIKNKSDYHMMFVNMLKTGNTNNITFERTPWLSSDMTYVTGTIQSQITRQMPVNSPQAYFTNELRKAISAAGLKYSGQIKTAPVPGKAVFITKHSSNTLENLISKTLKNSNNLYSELIFKAAGANYTNQQGTTENAVEMLKKYFSDIKATDNIVMVDACGISRNDLMTADWATDALNKIYTDKEFDKFAILLPKPMEGTLRDRLINISLRLRAKTGTASGISSIAGYIDTKNNKKYTFAIFIQNYNQSPESVKKLEDDLINEIYKM